MALLTDVDMDGLCMRKNEYRVMKKTKDKVMRAGAMTTIRTRMEEINFAFRRVVVACAFNDACSGTRLGRSAAQTSCLWWRLSVSCADRHARHIEPSTSHTSLIHFASFASTRPPSNCNPSYTVHFKLDRISHNHFAPRTFNFIHLHPPHNLTLTTQNG